MTDREESIARARRTWEGIIAEAAAAVGWTERRRTIAFLRESLQSNDPVARACADWMLRIVLKVDDDKGRR